MPATRRTHRRSLLPVSVAALLTLAGCQPDPETYARSPHIVEKRTEANSHLDTLVGRLTTDSTVIGILKHDSCTAGDTNVHGSDVYAFTCWATRGILIDPEATDTPHALTHLQESLLGAGCEPVDATADLVNQLVDDPTAVLRTSCANGISVTVKAQTTSDPVAEFNAEPDALVESSPFTTQQLGAIPEAHPFAWYLRMNTNYYYEERQ